MKYTNHKPPERPKEPKRKQRQGPALRKRAEDALAAKPRSKPKATVDARKLVHELQVHQIELEMQNEELKNSRVELEASHKRFSDLYDYSPIGYVTIDDNGIVLEANITFARLLGCDKESILQKAFYSLVFSEDSAFFLESFHHLHPFGSKSTIEIRFTRKDNSVFHAQVETIGYKSSDKSPHQYLLAILDITDRIKTARLLKIQTDDLVLANRELEAFSYHVSHDLRNPLNSIVACLAVLRKEGSDSKEAIRRIADTTQRMNEVIRDLLALSGIARQDVHRETTNLSDLVRSFYAELKSSNPNREIDFVIMPDCLTDADPGLVRILIENLVRNAWKYTSKTDRAHVEFGMLRDNSQTTYFLKDNGVGFDMTHVETIFKPFVRLHPDKEFRGTGIGLAIAKRIIEKHHGTIWANAEVGKGATFYFRLE
jgi:PAS domain S-box-containing protein